MHCLVMPSPRASPSVVGSTVVKGNGTAGTSFQSKYPFPSPHLPPNVCFGNVDASSGGVLSLCQNQQQTRLSLFSSTSAGGDSSVSISVDVDPETVLAVPSWVTPLGYAFCGLGMGLCNLISPSNIQICAHVLCPLWSLALGLHIASGAQQLQKRAYDSCWVWTGGLTLMFLPFVIVIGSPLFVGFYLLVFALFSSGMFWKRLQGVPFILSWFCWGGFLFMCTLGLGAGLPLQMHLCVAAFFSISLGVLNGGGGKFVMRLC